MESKRTVMELADDIMSNMGVMSEAVKPISEVTADSLHSVGKTYSEDLPGLTDEQRQSLIEGSVGGGVSIPTKKLDIDDDGDTEEVANTVKAKIKFDKTGEGTIEAINKVNAPRTNSKRSKKLRRASKTVPVVGEAVWSGAGEAIDKAKAKLKSGAERVKSGFDTTKKTVARGLTSEPAKQIYKGIESGGRSLRRLSGKVGRTASDAIGSEVERGVKQFKPWAAKKIGQGYRGTKKFVSDKLRKAAGRDEERTNEMTSVGSIGMSFARPEADPYKGRKSNWEPARSGKKDKLEFGKNWMNVLTSDFIDRSLGRLK